MAVATALSSPLLSSALPMRVASFALQGPESGKVQVTLFVAQNVQFSDLD